jgi:virginiamycin B lyase
MGLFGLLLAMALGWAGLDAVPAAQNASAAAATPPRLPTVIPFERLTPDAVVPVALHPGAAASDDAVWTLAPSAGGVIRIMAKDNTPGPPIAVGAGPCASLALAFDSVWVPLCGAQTIARLDVKTQAVSATIPIGVASAGGRIASSVGSLWALTDRRGVLTRFDPDRHAPVAEVYVPSSPVAVVAAENALWITSEDGDRLTRVHAHTNETVETIAVGPKPGRLAVGEGGVWTLNRGDGSVTRVDPSSNKVVATITIGEAIAGGEIAAGAGSIWISAPGTPIVRIDPRTNRAVRFTGDGGGAVLVAHGSLWVAAGPNTTWRLDPLLVATVRP